MTNIALLEAKCAECGHVFGHPSLGDFAYGAFVLCTNDGKHYATVDAFNEFAVRVHALIKSAGTSSLWSALAALADRDRQIRPTPWRLHSAVAPRAGELAPASAAPALAAVRPPSSGVSSMDALPNNSSSRRRFAARLNSGVRLLAEKLCTSPFFTVPLLLASTRSAFI